MKTALIFILIITVVTANPLFGFDGLGAQQFSGVFPNSQFYQALLERDVQKLIAPPDFPADLKQQALDVLTNAEAGFQDCDSAAYPFPYMQRICIIQTYSAARNALSAISEEAQARNWEDIYEQKST